MKVSSDSSCKLTPPVGSRQGDREDAAHSRAADDRIGIIQRFEGLDSEESVILIEKFSTKMP